MNDKPKRKHSDIAESFHTKRRVRWLLWFYFLVLIPSLLNIQYQIFVLVMILAAVAILLIGGLFVRLFSNISKNVLTNTLVKLVEMTSVGLASILLIISTFLGIVQPLDTILSFFSIPSGLLSFLQIILYPILLLFGLAFIVEIHLLINDFIVPLPNRTVENEKQKNDDSLRLSHELDGEADIPLELLAESESAEKAQR